MKRNLKERVHAVNLVKDKKNKFQRHTKAPLGTFSLTDAHFQQIHIDIVGPLPPSDGCVYLLTMIDRFSRWSEAIPIADMQTKTICRAFFHTLISRFGCPSIITTDQSSQMRSSLYLEFSEMLGTNRIRTTAYHPIANGIVERFHRHLKSSIKAHESTQWSEILPIVLLGIRTAVKEDIKASCAELVYGTTLQLPIDVIETSIIPPCNDIFVDRPRNKMREMNPVETSTQGKTKFYVNRSLKTCLHVFLRIDSVKPPMCQPDTGPHKVLKRTEKNFTIELNGRTSNVSVVSTDRKSIFISIEFVVSGNSLVDK
ncbi:Retrovirus-related Pol polyprotein from transposon 412 [Araneus ventricosus]|uniref:Retrovirus-related Pol polyprotein from transposon 412 n=1 Tax=Araneus ventricosus TaxID=182803 RepID=A0A4Y2NMM6_ARAVE|nr:Retrovirus-related Pol polyprotein from transposon 412 [Araneus ventricosus]